MTKRKKVQKKHPATRSNWTFESAFYDRIGQTPTEFIYAKLAAGSDVKSTKYLFEITEEETRENNAAYKAKEENNKKLGTWIAETAERIL